MIEISHNQARRLIRESLDDETSHRISTEQWASLQLHLENCADCRSYAENLNHVQRSLKRILHQRWDAGHAVTASGKGKAVMEDVQLIRGARKQRRKMALYALGGLIIFLTALLWRGYQVATAPLPTATPVPTEFGATATATPIRFVFHGVIAMEAPDETGAGEIYLYNSGFGPEGSSAENLTSHPANDIFPSWSPDGEWLAFLSNRDAPADRPEKLDLYVMHISGSRLTRLTNDPNITYEGPINWQLDGSWLGLIGHHWADPQRARFVYLVPTNSRLANQGGPRPLALTLGARGPVRFSPGDMFVAYRQAQPGGPGEIVVYDRSFGRYLPVTRYDPAELGLEAGADGSYGWSADGKRLIYLAQGAVDMQIKSTLPLAGEALRGYNSAANTIWEVAPTGEFLNGASFSPISGTNMIAYLRGQQVDSPGDTCAILHIRQLSSRSESQAAITVPNLCIQQGIGPENWIVQNNDPWIIVLARPQEQGTPGLYAIRILPNLAQVAVERLADVQVTGTPVAPESPLPGVPQPHWIHARPAGLQLHIDPQSVGAYAQASIDPAGTIDISQTGRIVFTQQDAPGINQLISINPDGQGRLPLTPAKENSTCAAVAPDSLTIAMLSNRNSRNSALKDVYLVNNTGGNTRQVTQMEYIYPYTELGDKPNITIYPFFDCPVWSPDGSRLAAVLHTGGNTLLAVIPTDGSAEAYYQIQPVSAFTPIMWLNERELALVYPGQEGGSSSRILAMDVDSARAGTLRSRTIITAGDWLDVYGMLLGPLTPTRAAGLAFFGAEFSSFEGTILTLHLLDLNTLDELPGAVMPSSLLRGNYGINQPFVSSDGKIAFFQRFPYDAAPKTLFKLYDPQTRILSTAFETNALVYDYAPSPDGAWVAFSTETGLYMADILGAQAGDQQPVFLLEGSIRDLDWR